MSIVRNKDLARRFYNEVINQRKLHLLDELSTGDFVDHNPEPDQDPGLAGVKKSFRQFVESFPDLHLKVEELIAENDRVGVRVRMTGTHCGQLGPVAPTGRTVDVTGFDWLRIKDGKVAERWGSFDMAGMMQQLGATPGPTPGDLKSFSNQYYKLLDAGKGDMSKIQEELFHPNHRSHFAGQPAPLNAASLQDLAKGFWAAFPNLAHTMEDQICEGNTVFNRMTIKATHKGDFAGVKATNKDVNISVMTSHRYVDGKLFEQRVEVDMMSLLVQIGAVPKP